ncbi:MAG: SCO family protein [Acidobacteriales bacterium]|nr:SCO family protein [Terriglobales bacterium]
MYGKAIVASSLLALLITGCKSDTRSTAFAAKHDVARGKHYTLRGKVIAVSVARKSVTVEHSAIAGYMPAMTMPFAVENESELRDVHPGDTVLGDLVVENHTAYLQSIEPTHPPGEKFTPAPKPGAEHYPKVGETAHDFDLKTQDGRKITLADYKGKPLLVDFVYTQCPLPQFCPLLNIKFAEMARAIAQNKSEYRDAQLLSVSIDPEHDTVPVLKDFSQRFDAIKTGDWNFATGTPRQVHDFASNMGLDYWPESGQVVHSVVVYLLDGSGKIAKIWYGNDWKTQEPLEEIKRLPS